jgi:hypothetical protein
MQYLFLVYSVTITLRVSGWLVAHHQKLTMYICENWYVLYVLVDCRRAIQAWIARRQSTKKYNTYQLLHIYIVTS